MSHLSQSQSHSLTSPDGTIELSVNVEETITWSVTHNGNTAIEKAQIAMDFTDGRDYGSGSRLRSQKTEAFNSTLRPVIPHKDSEITDEYNQLSLSFRERFQLVFRAYNDGIAYQFKDTEKRERTVASETMQLTFPGSTTSWFPQEESFYSHNERQYLNKSVDDIAEGEFCSMPVVFETAATKILITETALHDYPGMFIRGNGNQTVDAIHPKYILEIKDDEAQPDRNQTIVQEADYIAKIEGAKDYPWRVFMISDDDRTFIESNLTFQLSKPQVIEGTDWIVPGQVAWDWYNANNLTGVDFESGLNTASYKYYIDFASANGIEYVILDEGWTKSTTEILDFNPDMDVPELIRYGKEKGVELILWVLWKPLDANMDQILETYKSWGVKGIKVDFMQRNDQYMVSSYEKIAAKCAELEMLVDFHGAFKPSGLRRMYPNVISYEGVMGSEHNKWSQNITPEHNVTLPFIRMAAGPMDYTPGAMVNAHLPNHKINFERPMSLGTRAHQVAMYVVFESPLQMLCESPSRYNKEQETVDFLVRIPTTWDETVALHGAIGEYVAVARRKGDKWYVGAMTNSEARELTLDLSFLGEGAYTMDVYKDGVNAHRHAEDYKIVRQSVNSSSNVTMSLAGGGGWAAIISR